MEFSLLGVRSKSPVHRSLDNLQNDKIQLQYSYILFSVIIGFLHEKCRCHEAVYPVRNREA